jgi:hypothetical protein
MVYNFQGHTQTPWSVAVVHKHRAGFPYGLFQLNQTDSDAVAVR